MLKTFLLVLIAAVIGGTGHVMLAKGMRSIGDLTEAPGSRVAAMVGRAVTSPWLLFGVLLQAMFFLTYLTLLSRADVSQILPMTAIDYVVVAFLAHALLAEPVTPTRWTGIGLIGVGVFMVSRS